MNRQQQMEADFLRFHKEHPKVWPLFYKFTVQLIKRGFKNNSAKAVIERIRWETDEADSDGKSTFKINNNHAPYYARMFMKRFPFYDGFFRVRALISKQDPALNLPALGPSDFPYLKPENSL